MQLLIGIALLVIVGSLIGTGALGEPWNEFQVWVQEFGWAQKDIEFPLSQASLDIILVDVSGTNFITECGFHSDQDIPLGSGLSGGTAICKLLDANGNAIAEGRVFFNSYTGSDDLHVHISDLAIPDGNINDNVFDVKFIIEGPI